MGIRESLGWRVRTLAAAMILMVPLYAGSGAEGESEIQMRTVEVTADKAAKGKALYAVCMGCHGANGEGRIGIGPKLNSRSFLAAASDEFLWDTIALGRDGTTMVPWGSIHDEEAIENLISYIRSMNPVKPAKLDESPNRGSDLHGKAVWDSICASCHGRAGAGYQETANGTGIGRKAFLDSASDGFLRYLIKNGKTQTMMRGFAKGNTTAVANLTEQEIEDVIAYMRKNAW